MQWHCCSTAATPFLTDGMRLTSIELSGFKSFARKTPLTFSSAITAIVGPNGSGKSNVAESFRFVLGEQSMKSMRGRRGEDMIWNGSTTVPRGGRAGVRLVFDNSDRALNLDFDEVALERVVHRDGQNEYLLNGSQVRLRDINELLAQANIGASGHHIISQGEADRVLSASTRDRREMLEDALGLTAFLYKREEAQRKLGKTAENMREVEAMRRELVPHLRFLQSQVKKIEHAEHLRGEITHKYLEYLKREQVYLSLTHNELAEEMNGPKGEYAQLEARILHLREEISRQSGEGEPSREIMKLEERGRALRTKRETLTREEGRLEGELMVRQRMLQAEGPAVPHKQVEEFANHTLSDLEESLGLGEAPLRARINALIVYVKEFLRRTAHATTDQKETQTLEARKREIAEELHVLESEQSTLEQTVAALRQKIESEKDASREAERELFAAMARRSELEATLSLIRNKEEQLKREHEAFRFELGEAGALLGSAAAGYESYVVRSEGGIEVSAADMGSEGREEQQGRRRSLERLKIRLEESGLGDADEILKEHKETSERDEFLARELFDLEESIKKLTELIAELTETLETRFTTGVDLINTEFDKFFKLMFGGGTAALMLVEERTVRRGAPEEGMEETDEEEEEDVEEGVEISVSLPHKRIKGLHMLSGGERALTSIALIFAMSQVNPPPFLILDETDAALDEANSRRYGDMIESLAKRSQLIVITHNRETMSRAGVLYGITMGSDGVSKLLTVKFEEALAVAK